MMWNADMVGVKVIHEHDQFVHLEISIGGGESWLIMVVYANPNYTL